MRLRKESTRPDPPSPREIKTVVGTLSKTKLYQVFINNQFTGAYIDLREAEGKIYNSIHGYPVEYTED